MTTAGCEGDFNTFRTSNAHKHLSSGFDKPYKEQEFSLLINKKKIKENNIIYY